ncbi:MAG: hypothetical protein AB7F95_16080 [Burkholderiales bacterium]
MGRSPNYLVAEVQLHESDGSIHAYSDDIPGLNICGADREAVLTDVIHGIVHIFKIVHGKNVTVEWADTPAGAFQHESHPHRSKERFVMKPTFA